MPKSLMQVKGRNKGSLIDRIHLLIAGMPECAVFSSPTAGILIERLLHIERIPMDAVVTITKRRFPNSKITARRVQRLRDAMRAAA